MTAIDGFDDSKSTPAVSTGTLTTATPITFSSPAVNSRAQTGLTITGSCESGLTVSLSGAGLSSPETTTCTASSYSQAILFTAGEGDKIITVTQTDVAGNSTSANRTFVRDNTPPALTYSTPAANTTVQTGLTITGNCEAGLSVNLSGAGLSSPTSTTCAAGTFSQAIVFTAGEGNKDISIAQIDAAGNETTVTRTFIRDNTVPALAFSTPSANTTAQTVLTITGTCEAGLTVDLSGAGLSSPANTTCGAGTFSEVISFTAGEGTKSINVAQTDAAGNSFTITRAFVRDNTAPLLTYLTPSANTTGQTGLTITGDCEAGLTVSLSGAGLSSPATTTCTASSYSQAILFTAGEGDKIITVTQTDAAGNSTSVNRTFVRDNTPPTLTYSTPAANTTVQTGLTITGNCEAGLTVNLSGAGLSSPTSTTCAAGTFSQAIVFTAGEGNKDISIAQTDAAGNETTVTRTFIRDNTSPTLTYSSPVAGTEGTSGLTIAGDCEAGLTVNLSGAGLSSPASTTCVAGTFSQAIVFTAGNGNKDITISQTDAASNNTSVTRTFSQNIGWQQQAYIKAVNSDAGDLFGYRISLSGDTLAVGSLYESSNLTVITNGTSASADNSKFQSGAVYIYKRTASSWAQEAYIKAANSQMSDYFGSSVSLSGDTLAVGANAEDSNQNTITNGTTASTDDSKTFAGAVYVYRRAGTNWAQEAYIKAANSDANDTFGDKIFLSGETLAVGVPYEASNQTTITNGATASADNSKASSGAVYVYRRSGTIWAQEAYVKAENADASDRFGYSISISGDSLAVGAHLEDSNQITITNGATASADNSKADSGAVYVYRRIGNTWTQEAYIKAVNAYFSDQFGYSISFSGDTLAIGANQEHSNQNTITNGATASADLSNSGSGAVYIYRRSGTNWAQEAYIKAANNNTSDEFGKCVSLSGDTLSVNAFFEDSNQTTITNGTTASADNTRADSGAVYVYKRTGVNWAQEAYIKAANSDANDGFGNSISLSGDTLAVGSYQEDSNQTTITNGATASADNSKADSGAVYVYQNTTRLFEVADLVITSPNPEEVRLDWKGTWGTGNQIIVAKLAGYTAPADCSGGVNLGNVNTVTQNGLPAGMYTYRVCTSDGSLISDGIVMSVKVTGWLQTTYIKATNAFFSVYFGDSIALSGDTLAVGATCEHSNQTTITNGTTASADISNVNSGAVYIYRYGTSAWTQEAYIKAANSEASDFFGISISLSGDSLAVAALGESSNQSTITNGTTASADNSLSYAGAVYIYRRSGTNWAQEAYIKAVNVNAQDRFGDSVALSGEVLAVGAPYESSNLTTITNGTTASADNSSEYAGAVYIYRRSGTTWAQEAYIKASNSGNLDQFGDKVSLSGDTLAVGTFSEDSNQTTITNGTTASADNSKTDAGAVYVYRQTGTTWAQEAFIKAPNTNTGGYFGCDVSLSGNLLAVGAKGDASNQATITNGTTASADTSKGGAGAVFVFRRTGTTWTQESYIKASNPDATDYFGFKTSLSGNTLAVSARQESSNQTTITNGTTASADNSKSNSGAVYLFRRSGVTWAQEAYLKAANSDIDDYFASSVSLSGDMLAVGVAQEDSNQTTITNGSSASADNSATTSGAAYLYKNTDRLFDVGNLIISSPAAGQAKLDWKGTWGTGNQVIVAKQSGNTPPADCSAGNGGVNLGNVLTVTDTGLSSATRYTYRICTSDGFTMTDGIVISVTVQ